VEPCPAFVGRGFDFAGDGGRPVADRGIDGVVREFGDACFREWCGIGRVGWVRGGAGGCGFSARALSARALSACAFFACAVLACAFFACAFFACAFFGRVLFGRVFFGRNCFGWAFFDSGVSGGTCLFYQRRIRLGSGFGCGDNSGPGIWGGSRPEGCGRRPAETR
jgi:hypothetical protein